MEFAIEYNPVRAVFVISNFIRLNAATFDYSIELALERLGEMINQLAA